jgi:hypothetical protein
MQTSETETAPFVRGDRVTYRPRPAGVETVELVQYHRQGWPGWYVRTGREVGPIETGAHRYDRAELFEPAGISTTFRMPLGPIAVSGLRRWARRVGCAALFVLILAVLYGLNAVTP